MIARNDGASRDPLDVVAARLEVERIKAALPALDFGLVVAKVVHDIPQAEIARRLGVTPMAVSRRMARARRRSGRQLRPALSQ